MLMETDRAAILADHFHIFPSELGRLTDKYISKVLFHKRDKHGAILPYDVAPPIPVKPMEDTEEAYLERMAVLRKILGKDPKSLASIEASEARIREKYAERRTLEKELTLQTGKETRIVG